jgi:hypothetical protein
MVKNGHVHEGGKVGRSNATPTKFFSVASYDLKFMSFKFGNDIFITFEIPGSSYSWPVDKIHISLQFRPSVIRGPCINPPFFRLEKGGSANSDFFSGSR